MLDPPPFPLQGGLEKKDITTLLVRAAELAIEAGQLPSDRFNDHAFVITAALEVRGRPAACARVGLALGGKTGVTRQRVDPCAHSASCNLRWRHVHSPGC